MVRAALSARLDGEALPLDAATVDDHLAGCAGCRDWLDRAQRVTRLVRVQPVQVPDLTARILTAARAAGALPSPEHTRPSRWTGAGVVVKVRLALGLLAMVQLVLAIPQLLGAGHDAHTGREVAAFDVALAVGLLIAACYPEQARVFAPVVSTLVFCFAAISAVDVVQGVVSTGQVAVHAIAAAQAGLLWLLARASTPVAPSVSGMPRH